MSAELYHALIMDRSKNPRFAGRPEKVDAAARGDNPICGDRIEVFVHGSEIRHEGRGCAIMSASADLMAEAATGKTPAQIAEIRAAFEQVVTTGEARPELGDLNALAGVWEYRSRIRCATLPWEALAQALGAAHG
jgi:nitrogen fixation NifU-like protein